MGFTGDHRVKSTKLSAVFWLCSLLAATAQLPQPQLTSLSRCGSKAGETIEAKIEGTDLDEATLRFGHPGITARADAKDVKKQSITIGKEVPTGFYDVRVAGKLGLSNPRVFQVGEVQEVVGNDQNHTAKTAMEVTVPSVVNGAVRSQQEDWFKIVAKKGQKIFLRCWTQELDSKMVPALALFDVKGHELRRERFRPVLEWQAVEDGPLLVQLNDYIYKGGAEYFYRLEVRDTPVAPMPEPDLFWPLAKNPTLEVEPNDASHPQTVTLPCEIAGTFGSARDADVYRFHATKGEVWWIEVTSQRWGMKTNPRAQVQLGDKDVLELNDGPQVPGMPDFDGSHLDPVGKLEVKEDGDYTVSIRDLANVPSAVAKRYRLSIRKAAPDYALVAMPVPPKENKPGKDFSGPIVTVWNSNVRPGERMPIRVIVLRRDGFDQDIHLTAEGLPQGVSSSETVIGKDVQDTMVFVKSEDSAKAFYGAIKVIGKAGAITHQARGTTTVWNSAVSEFIQPSHWRYTQEIELGVVNDEVFPVALVTDEKTLEAKTGDKIKIHVRTVRKEGFKEPVKYRATGIAGLEKSSEFAPAATVAEMDNEVDLAPLKLQPGTYTLWFAGTTQMKVKGKDAVVNVYSTPVVLNLGEAEKKK